MKFSGKISILLVVLFSQYSVAATHWSNCMGVPQVEPIQDVFWKSSPDGSTGPDYQLHSGQIFSNGVSLCRSGQTLKTKDWLKEFITGFGSNTADIRNESQSSPTVIQTPEDFNKYLSKLGVELDNPQRLQETVAAFLKSTPVKYESVNAVPDKAQNPAIIVSESKGRTFILFASSNGKTQYASIMWLEKKR